MIESVESHCAVNKVMSDLGLLNQSLVTNPILKVIYYEDNLIKSQGNYEVVFLVETNAYRIEISKLNPTMKPIRPSGFSSEYDTIRYNRDDGVITISGVYRPTGKSYKVVIICNKDKNN